MTKDTELERNIQLYLKKSLGMAKLVDIPCHIDENTPKMSSILIRKFGSFYSIYRSYIDNYVHKKTEFEDFSPGCFQALAATETRYSPNYPFLMELLAKHANLNMMKVISPLLSNPNACMEHYLGTKFENKTTPIYYAAEYGHLQIIKFLVPLSDSLTVNAIQRAIDNVRLFGHAHKDHIVKYLNSIIESK